MSLYGAVGPVDVGEIEVTSHPEYIVSVSGSEPGRSTLNVLNYKYKYFPP